MVFKSYILMTLGIIFAKSIGFLRDIFFAATYGAKYESDIYFTVFSVVTLIFTGIGVSLSTLIIKQLGKEKRKAHSAQREYVSFFLVRVLCVLAIMTVLAYIFSPYLSRILIPNLSEEFFPLALKITLLMIPSMSFVVIAYVIYGVLQSRRVFFITSVMSVPYNMLVILALFVPDISITTISVITTLGWFSHILILLPAFYKEGFVIFEKSKGHSFPVKEAAWIFISNIMMQICHLADKSMVAGEAGMASLVNYSSNLFVTVSSIFIVSMSSVTFPALTRDFEEKNIKNANKTFKSMLSLLFMIFLPFLLTVSLFGKSIISLLYQRGAFSASAASDTAVFFIIYSFSIFGYLAEQVLNKILFLSGKYRFTVSLTIVVIALKIVSNMVLVPKYGAVAAALSTTVLLNLYAVLAFFKVIKVIGNVFSKEFTKEILKTALSGALALLSYFVIKLIFPSLLMGKISFLIPLAVCAIVYLASLFVTGEGKKLMVLLKK